MARIIDVSGPPGSGKSTLSRRISEQLDGRVVHIGAFGMPCFQLLCFASRLQSNDCFRKGMMRGYHPISLMSRSLRRAVIPPLVPIEAVSSLFRLYLRATVLAKKWPTLVIDEGLANTLAFYTSLGRLTERQNLLQAVASLYLSQYEKLASKHEFHIVFLDAPNDVLMRRWTNRGHPMPISADQFRYDIRDLITWVDIIREMLDILTRGPSLPFQFHHVDGAPETPDIPSFS